MAARIPAIAGNSATASVVVSSSPGSGKAQSTSFLDMLAQATDNAQTPSALPPVVGPRLKETSPTKTGNGNWGGSKSGSSTEPPVSQRSLISVQLLPQPSAQQLDIAAVSMRGVTTSTVVTAEASDSAVDSASGSPSDSSFSDSVKLVQATETNAATTATALPSVLAGGVAQPSRGSAKAGDQNAPGKNANSETSTDAETTSEATSTVGGAVLAVTTESSTVTDANVITDAATTADATPTNVTSSTTGVIADMIHATNSGIEHSASAITTPWGSTGLSDDTKSAVQDAAKLTTSVSASHMTSRSGPAASESAKPKQEQSSASVEVPRASTDASPSRAIDRDVQSASDTHKPAKQSTDIAVDAARPQATPPSIEITKSGAPVNISAGTQSVESHGGSQLSSGDDTSDHAGKHEGSASATGLGPGSKDFQSAGAPLVFADTMSAQSLDGSALKGTVSAPAPSNEVAPSQANVTLQPSVPHNSDRIEQQQSLETLISPFQSAKLIDRAGQSELHVGFQAGEFGNVDIRTSILRNQVTAEISVERGDLHNMLAVDLPHLKEKLSSHSITETNIVLSNQSSGTSSDSRQAYRRFTEASQSSSSRVVEVESVPEIAGIAESQTSSSQLDVRM